MWTDAARRKNNLLQVIKEKLVNVVALVAFTSGDHPETETPRVVTSRLSLL